MSSLFIHLSFFSWISPACLTCLLLILHRSSSNISSGLKIVNSLAWWSDLDRILYSLQNVTDSSILLLVGFFCAVRSSTDAFMSNMLIFFVFLQQLYNLWICLFHCVFYLNVGIFCKAKEQQWYLAWTTWCCMDENMTMNSKCKMWSWNVI